MAKKSRWFWGYLNLHNKGFKADKINNDLSKKYNELNYCGWEGIDSSEDIFVVHFNDGRKCRVMKEEEFKKVFKKQF